MSEKSTSGTDRLFPPERLNCKCDDPIEIRVMEFVCCDRCGGYIRSAETKTDGAGR